MKKPAVIPAPIFCPYCGGSNAKCPTTLGKCMDCGAVYFLGFNRYARIVKRKGNEVYCVPANCVTLRKVDKS